MPDSTLFSLSFPIAGIMILYADVFRLTNLCIELSYRYVISYRYYYININKKV